MQSDPLFHRLFKELPGCYFQLIHRPEATAEDYEMASIEYKSTSARLDGVFRPKRAEVGPAYLWEAQFYVSNELYANVLTKLGLFLKNDDPDRDCVVVIIYPSRAFEQKNLHPFRFLLNSEQLIRVYLDELPEANPDEFELGILQLIAAKPQAALVKAKAMVPRVRSSKHSKQLKRLLLQFIETVIVHQFPNWSREEIEKMLQVTDVRQTRVFQEGREEGLEEGRKEGKEEGREEGKEEGREEANVSFARRMLDEGRPLSEIVEWTGLTLAQIRKLSKKPKK